MTNMEKYICIFFIYSMAGWCMETFGGYFRTKKLVNRGFLIGPYLPVYGFGVSLITFFLEKYVNDLPILFFMSIIICGLLEYFTSWIMEKLFKARWWDYHNRKFNINGRICLETLIPFGATGTILLKFANPFVLDLLNTIPHVVLVWILRILIILIFIDVIISFTVISKFKKTSKEFFLKVLGENDISYLEYGNFIDKVYYSKNYDMYILKVKTLDENDAYFGIVVSNNSNYQISYIQ